VRAKTKAGLHVIRKFVIGAAFLATTIASSLTLAPIANAGEGHWSAGHGVQCRVVNGVVVCSKNRP